MVMHWHHSKDKFMAHLLPLVEKRLREHRGDLNTPEDEVCSTPAEVVSEYGTDTMFKAKRRCCMDDREDEPSVAPLHRPAPDGAHIRSNASAANGEFTPPPPPVQPLNLTSSSCSPSTTSASTPSTSSLYAKKPSKPQVGCATTRTRRCRSSTASSRRRRAWSLALSVSQRSSSRHDSLCTGANAI